jgi:MYXO-CTERM domain-containing protein
VADFAMVVPVPEVLMEANVKTLEDEVFEKLDRLTAPRLVEYFEQDPCSVVDFDDQAGNGNGQTNGATNGGVNVEARFQVGEYQIVILSSEESTALENWLTDNDYNVPMGAAPYYEPYIQAGMYFFVAKIDPEEVVFDNDGRAVLSPLRFDYDADQFSLPIRLGMINSAGEQDLIVHILARDQRYDLANYDNVTIPTNKEVTADTEENFGEFYKALFAETVQQNPGAVVTEYAWQASTCDPCPGPVLDPGDLLTLGADVLGNEAEFDFSWVVTRLHARYAKDEIGEDLVFRAAPPIVGGREFVVDPETGELEQGARESEVNNFQGRYIIRHPYQGDIDCEDPVYAVWGEPTATSAPGPTSTGDDITVDQNLSLAGQLVDDVDELDLTARGRRESGTTPAGGGTATGGCSGCSTGTTIPGALLAILFGGLAVGRRRRRRD